MQIITALCVRKSKTYGIHLHRKQIITQPIIKKQTLL